MLQSNDGLSEGSSRALKAYTDRRVAAAKRPPQYHCRVSRDTGTMSTITASSLVTPEHQSAKLGELPGEKRVRTSAEAEAFIEIRSVGPYRG